jgi:PAS domain-containing protein
MREITARKEAEVRLAYLASFLERNPDPVVEADLEGKVRYANPAALRLCPDLRALGPAHPWLADWAEVVRPFRQGQTDSAFRDVVIGDRVYQQSVYHVAQDGVVRIYGRDITERKRAEEEILRHAEELRVANEELATFNHVAVGRELRMVELKKQVNELCVQAGLPLRYDLDFEEGKESQ